MTTPKTRMTIRNRSSSANMYLYMFFFVIVVMPWRYGDKPVPPGVINPGMDAHIIHTPRTSGERLNMLANGMVADMKMTPVAMLEKKPVMITVSRQATMSRAMPGTPLKAPEKVLDKAPWMPASSLPMMPEKYSITPAERMRGH